MRTISVYKFEELSDESKKHAFEEYRNTNTEVFWAQETIDSLKGLFANCSGVKLKDYSLGEYHSSIDIEF